MDMDYKISIISGSYGGHRQHTSEDGQNWLSGISSLTPEPETLSKYSTKVHPWRKYREMHVYWPIECGQKNREDLQYRKIQKIQCKGLSESMKTNLGTASLLMDGDGGQNLKHTLC